MKKLLVFFAVICLVTVFMSSASARDKMVDLLVKKGLVTEEEVAAAEADATGGVWQSKSSGMGLGGYVQARYYSFEADGVDDTFQLKRALLWFNGNMWGDSCTVCITAYIHSGWMLLDAVVSYEIMPALKLGAGSFLLPYSLEQETSASRLYTLERSAFGSAILDHRDIGVRADGTLMEGLFGYNLAIVNGNGWSPEGMTTDDNDKKDVVARIWAKPFSGSEGPLADLYVAVATQFGETPMIGVDAEGAEVTLGDEKRNRYIGTAVWKYQSLAVQGEYAQQELEDTNVTGTGYYILGAYDFAVNGFVIQPVVKYAQYDPNDEIDDDETTTTTIGANIFLNPKSKVSVNYNIVDETPDVDNNELVAQWQQVF